MSGMKLQPTTKLVEILEQLGRVPRFKELMEYLRARMQNMAIEGHSFPDKTQRLWCAGRVQELDELLQIYDKRHEAPPQKAKITPKGF